MLGSHCAMSPGERTMPAAIVLPTAAAIPNHMPRTLSSPPVDRVAAEPVWSDAVVVVPSDMLDNGFSGHRCECVPCRRGGRARSEGAMIMADTEIAKESCDSLALPAVGMRIQI